MGTRVRYAGFAEEAAFNEAVPPAADFHVDIASASLDVPTDPEMMFEGSLGRSARTHRPGRYGPAGGNVVYAFDIDTVAHFLKWGLGNYVFTVDTPAPGTNTHEFYSTDEDVLQSFVSRLGKDHFEHVFSGCIAGSLELSVDNGFTQLTAEISAAKDSKAAIQAESALLLPSGYPLAFHEVTASLAGSDESAKVKSLTLSINNNLETDGGFSIGSRYARRILAGQRAVTLAMNLWYEDEAELERFWGDPNGPVDTGSTEFATALTFDAGADGTMVIDLPRVIYTSVQQQPSGRAEIVQAASATAYQSDIALADLSTVPSELLVTIESDQVTL